MEGLKAALKVDRRADRTEARRVVLKVDRKAALKVDRWGGPRGARKEALKVDQMVSNPPALILLFLPQNL